MALNLITLCSDFSFLTETCTELTWRILVLVSGVFCIRVTFNWLTLSVLSIDNQVHSHRNRTSHSPVKITIPGGPWSGSLHCTRRRMSLFAVTCIETSHYVSFVKHGPLATDWLFFDSMADREGEKNLFLLLPFLVLFASMNVNMGQTPKQAPLKTFRFLCALDQVARMASTSRRWRLVPRWAATSACRRRSWAESMRPPCRSPPAVCSATPTCVCTKAQSSAYTSDMKTHHRHIPQTENWNKHFLLSFFVF